MDVENQTMISFKEDDIPDMLETCSDRLTLRGPNPQVLLCSSIFILDQCCSTLTRGAFFHVSEGNEQEREVAKIHREKPFLS